MPDESPKPSEEGSHPKTENMIKADVLADYVTKIEAIQEEQASEQGAYMQQCAVFQGRIKDLKKNAKKIDGIPLKELNTILEDRKLVRKRRKLRTELEPDQKILFDQMQEALGDLGDLTGTPLGEAASAAEKARASTTAPSAEAKAAGVDAIGGTPLRGDNPVFDTTAAGGAKH